MQYHNTVIGINAEFGEKRSVLRKNILEENFDAVAEDNGIGYLQRIGGRERVMAL